MANKIDKILKEIEGYVKNKVLNEIKDIVENEVAPAAKGVITHNIREQVYNKNFGGSRSLRTGDFADTENLKSYISVESKNESCKISLTIRNETPAVSIFGDRFDTTIRKPYPGILGYWIEVGDVPVLWDNGNSQYVNKTFTFTDINGIEHKITKAFPPRPWMEETRKELNSGAYIQNAFIQGLKERGIIK